MRMVMGKAEHDAVLHRQPRGEQVHRIENPRPGRLRHLIGQLVL